MLEENLIIHQVNSGSVTQFSSISVYTNHENFGESEHD